MNEAERFRSQDRTRYSEANLAGYVLVQRALSWIIFHLDASYGIIYVLPAKHTTLTPHIFMLQRYLK